MKNGYCNGEKKRSEHYVNNKEFLTIVIVEYKVGVRLDVREDNPNQESPTTLESVSLRLQRTFLTNQTSLTTCSRMT